MAPIISCLIPVYNSEPFLGAALQSIADQTVADFEVILVNDGSTDGSDATLADFAARDPRFKVFTKPNGGIVSALNHGLRHCTGTYVARMDGDDIALPDRFAFQIETFEKHPDAVAVGGHIQSVDANGNLIGIAGSPSRVARTDLGSFPPKVANVQHSAGTFRRDALEKIGGYRSTFPHAEDYDLYLRLAPFGSFQNPAKLSIYYRVHAGSLSVRNLTRQETSAALAELSALARLAGRPDPGDEAAPLDVADYVARLGDLASARTVQRYIDFRVWRRLAKIDPVEAVPRRRAMLAAQIGRAHV